MSLMYKEKNSESAFELFNKRSIYLKDSDNADYSNLIDFFAEKMMYGRVSRLFVPITIPQGSIKLKSLSKKSKTNSGLKALNFVVDAFNDLKQQFDKCLQAGKIDDSDDYLSSLKVYKAHMDPYNLYEKYLRKINAGVRSSSIMDSQNIKNFDEVPDRLTQIMDRSGLVNPITFPAFVKSKKVPINISGLAIEIADLNASNDQEKIDKFIKSKNWNFYLNACRTYGFMVDKNVPWRLIADIGSAPMIEYAKKYNLNDTNTILLRCYESASYRYYNSFTQRMLDLYYTIKPTIIIKKTECKGKTIIKTEKPIEYKNKEILQEKYGQESFLMLYCKLRFSEEESQYTEEQKNILIKDVIQLSKNYSENYAINIFERFLNKTFDYQGSLSYYLNKSKAIEQEEIFGEQTKTRY